ncbi:hypothetical protein VPNG_06545 [Cytospora leucostoma]|uniref:DNA/RNA-binding protein Alba-like domain-containing protein n=1 Tax=Cytospora leucostoma TaxID=1230097 RepID=A0A423X289_9PEZI|nr:hypothetical protein VPNG_06545 [Cytospora leucostoma]
MHEMAIASNWTPSSGGRTKRRLADVDTIPATAISQDKSTSNKKRRVGPSSSSIPRTLPMQPNEDLLAELKGKYTIVTASVISSSKVNKKVTQVLSHLGHVDLFSPSSIPGVMMLHARVSDSGKMVTVMELAKRRMNEAGQAWYQYNRVYEVADDGARPRPAGKRVGQTVIKDTVLNGQDEEEEDEEEDDFEPVETAFDRAIRDKPPSDSKTAYMSIFLSRVPIPELQSKTNITLQTNNDAVGRRHRA